MNWSETIFTTPEKTCPRCANNQYQTGIIVGNEYKRCIECGRVSIVESDDNLTELEQ